MSKKPIKGYLMVIISAILYGLMPFETVVVSADSVTGITVSAYRSFVAVPVLLVACILRRESFRPKAEQIAPMSIAAALGYIVTPVLLLSSYSYIDTGMATTLHFVYPALVVIGCCVFLHEKLNVVQLGCIALCILGVVLFYEPTGAESSLTGFIIAIASGAVYAAYIVMLSGRQLRDIPVLVQSLIFSLIAAVIFVVMGLMGVEYSLPAHADSWAMFMILTLSVGVLAPLLFQAGVKYIGSSNASIISTFEPLTSIFMGALMFQEKFGIRACVGSIAILASVILLTVFEKKHKG